MQTTGQRNTLGVVFNPQEWACASRWLIGRGLMGEFAAAVAGGNSRIGAPTRNTTIASTRRNVRRTRTARAATTNGTGITGNAERLMTWARESGKPFSLSEASKATGIPYNSAAKLVAGLVRKHNLGKSGRGVYQLGTAPAH